MVSKALGVVGLGLWGATLAAGETDLMKVADGAAQTAAAAPEAAPAAAQAGPGATAATGTALGLTSTALPTPWKDSLVSSLNLSQGHFSNWVAGGEDSLLWVANLAGSANGKWTDDSLENNLKLAYGQSTVADEGVRKVADTIHADTTYIERLNPWVNPFVGATFDTQFNTGYHYFSGTVAPEAVSKFMDPGYVTESLGLGSEAGDWFKVRVGAASQQVYTHDFGKYSEDAEHPTGQACRTEYGATLVLGLKWDLGQNLLFTSEMDAFSDLEAVDQVQAKWNNQLTAKVNTWLSANVAADALYDHDQSTAGQFMESLSLAFSYNLI